MTGAACAAGVIAGAGCGVATAPILVGSNVLPVPDDTAGAAGLVVVAGNAETGLACVGAEIIGAITPLLTAGGFVTPVRATNETAMITPQERELV